MEPRSRLQIKLEQERIAKVTGEHHTNGAIDQGSYFRQVPGILSLQLIMTTAVPAAALPRCCRLLFTNQRRVELLCTIEHH